MTNATESLIDQEGRSPNASSPLPDFEKFCPGRNSERQNHVGNNQKRASGKANEEL